MVVLSPSNGWCKGIMTMLSREGEVPKSYVDFLCKWLRRVIQALIGKERIHMDMESGADVEVNHLECIRH